MTENQSSKTPWHIWVVGILSVLWNSGGVFDFSMTQSNNEEYLSQMTAAQVEFFNNMPSWIIGLWGFSVLSAFLGGFLILMRKSLAYCVYLLSFATMIICFVRNYCFAGGWELLAGNNLAKGMTFAIISLGILLIIYCRAMKSCMMLTPP